MCCLLIGIVNTIAWFFYMSGAILSPKNRVGIALITHFMHKYCYWYFDIKIAHLLSIFGICYSVFLLKKQKLRVGRFLASLLLNIFWIFIYIIAYWN